MQKNITKQQQVKNYPYSTDISDFSGSMLQINFFQQQVCRYMTSDSHPEYPHPNKQTSLKSLFNIENFHNKFSAIETQLQPSSILSQIQNEKFYQKISKQEIEYNHGDHLPVLNETTQKYFLPHQIKGPSKNNIRKSLAQLKQLFLNQYNSICVSYNKYSTDQIKALFHSVKDYYDEENQINKLTSLYTAWARMDRIIQYLSFKRFTKLKILNIGGNFIQTIQPLCRVYLPEIQDVFLWNNHIKSVKTLRRVNWPNLRLLDVHGNMIGQIQSLRYMGSRKIQCVNLDSNLVTNFYEVILLSSKSVKLKVSLINNRCIKFLNKSGTRRRKIANQITPSSMRVKYV